MAITQSIADWLNEDYVYRMITAILCKEIGLVRTDINNNHGVTVSQFRQTSMLVSNTSQVYVQSKHA
eukprot:6175194-Pleurochrysis_carterae.AAC.3